MVILVGNEMHTETRVQIFDVLFAFSFVLIYLGKICIVLFSLQLKVNGRTDGTFWPWYGNRSRRKKSLNSNLLNSVQKLTLCHILRRG